MRFLVERQSDADAVRIVIRSSKDRFMMVIVYDVAFCVLNMEERSRADFKAQCCAMGLKESLLIFYSKRAIIPLKLSSIAENEES